ncbi:MAG: hypothetical protein ACTSYB_09760 [Candidatus Helarchaeota archaeon]
MTKLLNEKEKFKLQERLQSRLDYYIAALLWGLFFFSFISI